MKNVEVLCLGELLMDMVAQEDSSGAVTGFSMKPGGAAGNVAVAVSRLGKKAGVLSKVSADFFGAALKKAMEENGVDTKGLILDAARKIALAFVTFDKAKKPNYLFYRENAASVSLCADEIDDSIFQGVKALYFSSMGLVKDPLCAANYEAVALAHKAGARVAFDPNIRFGVWPSKEAAKEAVLKMMPHADLCKMNDEELAFLFGNGPIEEMCARLLRQYPKLELLAVTLGENGACLAHQNGFFARVGALDNDVVDTVGAGDSFFSTLLYACIECGFKIESDVQLAKIAQMANAAALITAKRPGGIPAMPTLSQVREMCARYL